MWAHSALRIVGYGVWASRAHCEVKDGAQCGARWWRCALVSQYGRWRCVAYKRNARGAGVWTAHFVPPRLLSHSTIYKLYKILKIFTRATVRPHINLQKNFYKISTTPPCASHNTPVLSIYTARQWWYIESKTMRGRYAYKTKTGRAIL